MKPQYKKKNIKCHVKSHLKKNKNILVGLPLLLSGATQCDCRESRT